MKQSESLLSALLSDSAITRTSHPALVSLLELAAQGPGLEKGEDREKWAPRISRQWHDVAEAFHDGGKVPKRGKHMLLTDSVRNWIAELQPVEP